jgi:hypothetical protein
MTAIVRGRRGFLVKYEKWHLIFFYLKTNVLCTNTEDDGNTCIDNYLSIKVSSVSKNVEKCFLTRLFSY